MYTFLQNIMISSEYSYFWIVANGERCVLLPDGAATSKRWWGHTNQPNHDPLAQLTENNGLKGAIIAVLKERDQRTLNPTWYEKSSKLFCKCML